MNLQLVLTVFVTIFLAEIGDKTQLATLLYAADAQNSKLAVFVAAAAALIVCAALAVGFGGLIGRFVRPELLSRLAGVGFIAVGLWTLFRG